VHRIGGQATCVTGKPEKLPHQHGFIYCYVLARNSMWDLNLNIMSSKFTAQQFLCARNNTPSKSKFRQQYATSLEQLVTTLVSNVQI
jgi:hypothetical protein